MLCRARRVAVLDRNVSPGHGGIFAEEIRSKVRRAKSIRGTRFLHILSPCPPGWKYSDDKTIEMGRLAVHHRIFPLLEIEDGTRWRFTMESRGDPVEPYIRAQGRFRHLTEGHIALIQAEVDARWEHLNRLVASSAGPNAQSGARSS